MSRKARTLVCLFTGAACALAWGQSNPSAYVYVSSNYSGSNNRTVAFWANTSGQLAPIPGSPFPNNITSMAVNGKFLFGSDNVPNDNGRNIYSYLIQSNGVLKYLGATNIQKWASEDNCNDGENLLLDHSGGYLYSYVVEANCNSGTAFESFKVNWSTGMLSYLGMSSPNTFTLGPPLTFATNNVFAYAAGGNGSYSGVNGYQKQANGNLTDLKQSYPLPSGTPSANSVTYSWFATADTTNHLALVLYYAGSTSNGVTKIATYAINTTTGQLTTNSTYSNMPTSAVGTPTATAMAPSGKLLAVGGQNGLQLFNFNPSGQATPFSQLITRSPIAMMYWDNQNHLYAISNTDSDIHVFTLTSTGATEVQGSPWPVPHPVAMIVQPK